jgi:hypothetical protein
VVQGVAEVLLDEPDAPPAMRRRLARLERGMNELTDLINVLLGLARRTPFVAESVDARTLLEECAASVACQIERSDLRVIIEAQGSVVVPRMEAVLALRGILRRLVPPGAGGVVHLRAQPACIGLHYGAPGAAAADADTRRSDRHLGLTLVGRYAQHLGWRLDDVTAVPGGRGIAVILPAAD